VTNFIRLPKSSFLACQDGLIFFPEFCRVVLRKFREEDEEQFAQVMFKVS
jgi:hypothetical protein